MTEESITKTLEEGLNIMIEALDSNSPRRWAVGQGAYDGAVAAANLKGVNVSDYKAKSDKLVEIAKGKGFYILER